MDRSEWDVRLDSRVRDGGEVLTPCPIPFISTKTTLNCITPGTARSRAGIALVIISEPLPPDPIVMFPADGIRCDRT